MANRVPTYKPPHVRNRQKRKRATRQERGYGSDWQRLRKAIIYRDGYRCRKCNVKVDESAPVDHITPKRRGGTDHPSNLQTLCKQCHDRKTGRGG